MKSRFVIMALSLLSLNACSMARSSWNPASWVVERSDASGRFKVGSPYKVGGVRYTPKESYSFSQTGIASWYGPNFHGKLTANGEVYNQKALTAAHKTLQLPSIVRVTNLENGRSIVVRVNDRGPFSRGRIIDMSERGAELLQFKNQGTAKVKVQILPEESRFVAQAAREGRDISGIEVALNEGKTLQEFLGQDTTTLAEVTETETLEVVGLSQQDINQEDDQHDAALVVDVTEEALLPTPSVPTSASVPAPDPSVDRGFEDMMGELVEVKTVPVVPTNIYVQAGSFGLESNAQAYAKALSPYGQASVSPVTISNRTFYRVRLGPIETVDKADAVLEKMAAAGEDKAIIIVGD